eukprot:UN04411
MVMEKLLIVVAIVACIIAFATATTYDYDYEYDQYSEPVAIEAADYDYEYADYPALEGDGTAVAVEDMYDEDDFGVALASNPATYTIKSGDYLSKIASKYGCTVAQLQSLNNIPNANQIKVGQVIKLCNAGSSNPPTNSSPVHYKPPNLRLSAASFAHIEKHVPGVGKLSADQKKSLNLIVKHANANSITLHQLAYILATVWMETGANKLVPVEEQWWVPVAQRQKNLSRYLVNGKYYWGRGYCQLTWHDNYKRVGKLVGRDLVNNPNLLVTDWDLSAQVLVRGMKLGAYTGKGLESYINSNKIDYYNARRIVNGLDKAQQIADVAKVFAVAIKQ